MGVNQRNQIVMSEAEIAEFVARSRTATLATTGADGSIHLVAMWYAHLDGEVWIELSGDEVTDSPFDRGVT